MPDEAGKLPREEAYKDLLNLLHEISSTITNKLDIYDLIRSMVTGLKRLGFDRAGVWLLDESAGKARGTWGTDEEGNLFDETDTEIVPEDLPDSQGYFVRITDVKLVEEANTVDGIYIPKGEESRFEEIWGIEPPYPGFYARTERGDNISLPIVVSGKVIGAIAVDNFITRRQIEKEDAEVLAMFTANAGVILHNARLTAEIYQRTVFLESILDNANFWISLSDKEGRVTLWNKAAERISGYTREEAMGHGKIWELLYPDPDDRKIFPAKHQQTTQDASIEGLRSKIVAKSGAEKTISWYCLGIQDVDGKLVGNVSIGEDITERMEMEVALRRSAEGYIRAIETPNSFVVELDREGRITLFNRFAEQLTGYTRSEVTGEPWFDIFIPPDRREDIREVFEGVKSAGEPLTYENTIMTKDGRELLLLWTNSRIRDDAGNVVGTLSYGIDVTQQRKLEKQLAQSEKMSALGQLISGVAHELNNPLTGVIGYSQLLTGMDCDGEVGRMVNIISREAERCHKIVDSLLQFAREYDQEKEYTQINDIIELTLSLKRYQLYVDNIQLELDLSEDIQETVVDPHQMQQVFMNIINNAHQAMVEHSGQGKLTVETELKNDMIVIRFSDTGPGIPEENMERIFDPFFTTKALGKGTGLGLSICHGIVEKHGGSIYAESEANNGATFIVELPLESGEAAFTAKPEPEESEFVASEFGSKILIVDDEQEILKLFTDILDILGHKAVTARSGSQAMERLSEDEYDLIICDMKMPGFGGEELYNHISVSQPKLAERIIFVTGDTVNPETQSFLQSTGNPYIGKPFRLEEIRRIMIESLPKE
jgi:PAS domain S-box-containing protein